LAERLTVVVQRHQHVAGSIPAARILLPLAYEMHDPVSGSVGTGTHDLPTQDISGRRTQAKNVPNEFLTDKQMSNVCMCYRQQKSSFASLDVAYFHRNVVLDC
jgi:hypothetical protein